MPSKLRVVCAGSVAAAFLLTLTTGCSSDSGGKSAPPNNQAPVPNQGGQVSQGVQADPGRGGPANGGAVSGGGSAGAGGGLKVQPVAKLGTVVADGQGHTLYRFDKDTANPPKSNCDGDCASAWPPVPAGSASAAPEITPGLIGSVARADGTQQLTLAGWPVYRYAKDTAPGDAKGEGVGGTWHALAADGKKAAGNGSAPGQQNQPAGQQNQGTGQRNQSTGQENTSTADGGYSGY